MRQSWIMLIILTLAAVSCEIKPQPISYGSDTCHYCSMTIIDKQHAAQLVTKKGKVYSFDAIECMLQSDQLKGEHEVALLLCNDYSDPGVMIDATQGTFLISERVPSPMGGYLSGFTSMEMAKEIGSDAPAEYLNWEELYIRYRE